MQQRLLALTVFLAALLQSAAAQAPLATTLQPPTRQLSMADSFNRTKAFPAVSNGHVLVFPRVVTERDTILVTSLSTEVRQSVPFAIAGASQVRINGAAVAANGNLLVAGSYDRAADHARVNYVAVTGKAGVNATFDVGQYEPERICSAPDGTFWTLGQIWADESRAGGGRRADGKYGLLRSFGANGAPRRAFLRRETLPADEPMDLHPLGRFYGRDVTPAYLSCGDASVGVYIGHPADPTWFEVDLKTGTERRWRIEELPRSRITGLTLLAPRAVYASFGLQRGRTFLRGLYRLALQGGGDTATWTRVNTRGFAMLLGRDGDELVYRRRAARGEGSLLFTSRTAEAAQP